MRNDEGDVGIFRGEEFADGDFAHDIVEHRQPASPRRCTNFARDAGIMPMHLEANEAVLFHGFAHEFAHAAAIAFRMNESKPEEPARMPRDNARHGAIRHQVICMKCRKENRPRDARFFAPSEKIP